MTEVLVKRVYAALEAHRFRLVAAESCTGGWLAKCMTDYAGSSNYFDRGFVTYSNKAKQEMLGVSLTTLQQYGAVSEVTVREMAEGALTHSRGDISVAISGIAGPGGGSEEKPVGLVWFAWSIYADKQKIETKSEQAIFSGSRNKVRIQAVNQALMGVFSLLEK